ncbi:MAG: myo-inositol-1(or 4)-monophosphatase [Pseudohongiellaceae bacterium]|jgi:myo-inositol-1(or 4)-monophosphatase
MTVFEFTLNIAREAGQLINKERNKAELTYEYKNGIELVTNADLMADNLIVSAIKQQYPDDFILSEESSPHLNNVQHLQAPVWIIDPIDGTVNFAHGHNQSAVSIAYVVNGQIEHGVVFNPFTNEMFAAEKGKGAYLNGVKISVAKESQLSRCLIATGFPYDKSTIEPMLIRVNSVLRHCADIRRLGSAALDICFLAAGRLDGYYESLSLWDFAAAQLIAIEAGAQYGHFSEVPDGIDPQFYDKDILLANPELFAKLRALLVDSTK